MAMYTKPEVAVLGEASKVILGKKICQGESMDPLDHLAPADSELDD